MADFIQAIKWMKNGNKVIRAKYKGGELSQEYTHMGASHLLLSSFGRFEILSYSMAMATDWEIFEEYKHLDIMNHVFEILDHDNLIVKFKDKKYKLVLMEEK